MTYATEQLFEEVAYVAYHFHWDLDRILGLEHSVRHQFISEIGSINERISSGG